jgi:hypothetical protein
VTLEEVPATGHPPRCTDTSWCLGGSNPAEHLSQIWPVLLDLQFKTDR